MAVAPESVRLVEHDEDLDALEIGGEAGTPMALLAQTTLSHDEWRGIVEPARRALPRPVDAQPERPVLRHHQPPGRAQGHRRRGRRRRGHRLGELVEHRGPREGGPWPSGCPRVVRVNDAAELPDDLSGTVGVTAGASAPEALVEEVVAALAPRDGVTEVTGHRRRGVLPAPARAAGAPAGRREHHGLPVRGARRPCGPIPVAEDRAVAAADVLDMLAA